MRRESKDHATLSDIYLNNVIMRFMQISEDSTRLLKKVRVENTLAMVALNLNTVVRALFEDTVRVRESKRFLWAKLNIAMFKSVYQLKHTVLISLCSYV